MLDQTYNPMDKRRTVSFQHRNVGWVGIQHIVYHQSSNIWEDSRRHIFPRQRKVYHQGKWELTLHICMFSCRSWIPQGIFHTVLIKYWNRNSLDKLDNFYWKHPNSWVKNNQCMKNQWRMVFRMHIHNAFYHCCRSFHWNILAGQTHIGQNSCHRQS